MFCVYHGRKFNVITEESDNHGVAKTITTFHWQ